MITLINQNNKGHRGDVFRGLQSDGYPTQNLNNGDEFQVMDTGETYAWNQETKTWVKVDLPKSGADFANGVEF